MSSRTVIMSNDSSKDNNNQFCQIFTNIGMKNKHNLPEMG